VHSYWPTGGAGGRRGGGGRGAPYISGHIILNDRSEFAINVIKSSCTGGSIFDVSRLKKRFGRIDKRCCLRSLPVSRKLPSSSLEISEIIFGSVLDGCSWYKCDEKPALSDKDLHVIADRNNVIQAVHLFLIMPKNVS